ncbi:hypothetical protein PIIN_05550 [Serendipita indica DSM 11827]|uniref:Uncharacterized protein n=1 Tax=Serendipita indica (strain DSM 11827) TaxID=1109443 RepID=G4TJX0_SERID|nr:hypothetical protein PIIN_05550 [Serendipita indica DSM 11827]
MSTQTSKPEAGQSRLQQPDLVSYYKQDKLCSASQLAPEVLLEIFHHFPRQLSVPWDGIDYPAFSAWSLATVCRTWHNVAMAYLYRSVCITTAKSAQLFYQTLVKQRFIRSLVKALSLPDHGNLLIPSSIVAKLFIRIINMIDSLDRLYSPVGYLQGDFWRIDKTRLPVLLIALGRHSRLEHLSLVGNSYTVSGLTNQLMTFRNLRTLGISRFRFMEHVDPRSGPLLPLLEKIIITEDFFPVNLVDWMLTLPRLQTLELFSTPIPTPIPKILSCGKLRHLSIWWSYTLIDCELQWFANCSKFHTLEVTPDILSDYVAVFPLSLKVLRICCDRFNITHLGPLQRYAARKPSIKDILFRFLNWTPRKDYRKQILQIFNDSDVKVSFEMVPCAESSEFSGPGPKSELMSSQDGRQVDQRSLPGRHFVRVAGAG